LVKSYNPTIKFSRTVIDILSGMNTRKLGSSDLEIPIITLGTMTWGNQNSEADAHSQLDYAINERGLYFIDTAEMYPVPPNKETQGRTETYIGNWLKKRGKRDDLIIASKVSVSSNIVSRDIGPRPRYDRKSIREAIDGSLKRLQTDYIDLYQVHWPERKSNFFGVRGVDRIDENERFVPLEEVLFYLSELVDEGKVRYIGVSNESPWGLAEYLRASRDKNLPRVVSIQNQYSLTNRSFEIGLAEMVLRENIGMLAYSTLGMGALAGKYLGGKKPEGSRLTIYPGKRGLEVNQRYNPKRGQKALKRYVELAKDNNIDPATMAIAFAISREFVTSTIIGATNLDQLKTDINAGEIKLPADILTEIEKIHDDMPNVTQ
jgi:aryl-alcohol dehydrogenase-like predicted oxidoreductase